MFFSSLKTSFSFLLPPRALVLSALGTSLLLAGCFHQSINPHDTQACVDHCQINLMGSPQETQKCQKACSSPTFSNVMTSSLGPYRFEEGKNALNQRNSTASRA